MNQKSKTPKSVPLRILIVEDIASDAELMERELSNGKIQFTSMRVETEEAFIKALKKGKS